MRSTPSVEISEQSAPLSPPSPGIEGDDFDLLWRDAAPADDSDPKTSGFDLTGDTPTTDLPRFEFDVAALLDVDSSLVDGAFLSDFHGGHTIDIESDDQLTQPRDALAAALQVISVRDKRHPQAGDSSIDDDSCSASTPTDAVAVREITTGTILRARYVLGEILGRGGNSIVFRAQDLHRLSADETALNQIAVKVLLPELRTNPHALTRMKREFRQMQCLTHPGIARVFDLDHEGDDWFMTMELLAGQTINSWMRETVSSHDALQVIGACCDALAHAHAQKILHGDLKPSNVLVAEDGSIKIIDFGSAPSPGTRPSNGTDLSLAATPSFASPQVLAGGAAEPRDDVFSLACLSYTVLSRGLHPFARKSSLDAFNANLRPAYVPAIPPRLFDVIVKGLAWEREQRPASVREFLHGLIGSDLSRSSALARDSVVQQAIRVLATGEHARTPVIATPVVSPPREATHPSREDTEVAAAELLNGAAAKSGRGKDSDVDRSDEPDPPASDRLLDSLYMNRAAKVLPLQLVHPHGAGMTSEIPSVSARTAAEPAGERHGESASLVADSLQDVPERLLHIDADAAALLTLPDLNPDFSNSHQSSSLAAEYRRSLIVLALVFAGTVFLVRQAVDQDPIRVVASTPIPSLSTPMTTAPAAAPPAPVQPEPIAEVSIPAPVRPVIPNAPGVISFDTASIQAGSAQTLVAVTLKRLQSTRGTAKVTWRIEKGTARPGIDYVPVEPQVIKFIEGQPARSIFIPLLNTGAASTARGPRTFTVSLQKVAGGPVLGSISKVSVTIPPPHEAGSSSDQGVVTD